MSNKKHGGNREGAGRPSDWTGLNRGEAESVAVKLPKQLKQALFAVRDSGYDINQLIELFEQLAQHQNMAKHDLTWIGFYVEADTVHKSIEQHQEDTNAERFAQSFHDGVEWRERDTGQAQTLEQVKDLLEQGGSPKRVIAQLSNMLKVTPETSKATPTNEALDDEQAINPITLEGLETGDEATKAAARELLLKGVQPIQILNRIAPELDKTTRDKLRKRLADWKRYSKKA